MQSKAGKPLTHTLCLHYGPGALQNLVFDKRTIICILRLHVIAMQNEALCHFCIIVTYACLTKLRGSLITKVPMCIVIFLQNPLSRLIFFCPSVGYRHLKGQDLQAKFSQGYLFMDYW